MNQDSPDPFTLVSRSPEQTQEIARVLGQLLMGGEVLALIGELGAGKTCFVQGLAGGLGVQETVNSPSFVVSQTYQGRLALAHFDWYRLSGEDDAISSGFDDALAGNGVVVVEWADRLTESLPPDRLEIRFEAVGDQTRRLEFIVRGESAEIEALVMGLVGQLAESSEP